MSALQQQLAETADAVRVPAGSSTEIAALGRRRSRQASAARVVAAVTVAAIAFIGVRQLSSDEDIIQSGPVGREPGVGGNPILSRGPAGDGAAESATQRALGSLVNTRPAELVDAEYTWEIIPAESTRAVALRFDPDKRYAVSSADGTIDELAIFEQTDGVWTQLATFEGIGEAMVVGDRVYVDPEPGIERPRELSVFDIPTRSWSSVAPPAAVTTQISDVLVANTQMTVSADGEHLLMLVSRTFEVDAPALGLAPGWQVSSIDADTVSAYNAYCVPSTTVIEATPGGSTTAPFSEYSDTTTESAAPLRALPEVHGKDTDDCYAEFPTAEVELSPSDLAIVNADKHTLWNLDGQRWEQIALPQPAAEYELSPQAIVAEFVTAPGPDTGPGERRFFELGDDDRLHALLDGTPLAGGSGGSSAERFVSYDGPYIVTEDRSSGDWYVTDLRGLGAGIGEGGTDVRASGVVAVSDGGVVATADIRTNLPTAQQTITSGDYELRFGVDLDATLVNTTSGAVPYWRLSTESGRIEVFETTEDGEPIGDDPLATFDEDWRSISAISWNRSEALLVSSDGERYVVITPGQISASAGLSGELSVSDLRDVRVDDGRIIARVSFEAGLDENGDGADGGIGTNFILVGTPV